MTENTELCLTEIEILLEDTEFVLISTPKLLQRFLDVDQ